MNRYRRVFPYTLSARDYAGWRTGTKIAKKYIEGVACKRARRCNRNVALILAPNGAVLIEVTC